MWTRLSSLAGRPLKNFLNLQPSPFSGSNGQTQQLLPLRKFSGQGGLNASEEPFGSHGQCQEGSPDLENEHGHQKEDWRTSYFFHVPCDNGEAHWKGLHWAAYLAIGVQLLRCHRSAAAMGTPPPSVATDWWTTKRYRCPALAAREWIASSTISACYVLPSRRAHTSALLEPEEYSFKPLEDVTTRWALPENFHEEPEFDLTVVGQEHIESSPKETLIEEDESSSEDVKVQEDLQRALMALVASAEASEVILCDSS